MKSVSKTGSTARSPSHQTATLWLVPFVANATIGRHVASWRASCRAAVLAKLLAEWMIYGETEADAWSMDIARYGDFQSNREYIKRNDRSVLFPPLRDELS